MNPNVAHRCRPCRGETRSGDAAIVRIEEDASLFAVVDGLGHGWHAANAADLATEFLRRAVLRNGVRLIMEGLHEALHATRGAAATLCLVGPAGLEGSGVGNVGLRVFGSRIGVVLTPGILGGRLRNLRVFQGTLEPGTRLLLHSDGIRATFSSAEATRGSPVESCDAILRLHGRDDDDATILIGDLQ